MREASAGCGRSLKPHEFSQVRRMMYENFGVDLEGKEVLIEARLGKKMRELGYRSFRQYYEYVRGDPTGEALTAMVDALTTNHTSFFREPQHFDLLRKMVAPAVRPGSPLRIWSAACSTGEEPYSIAFTILEAMAAGAVESIQILATDISSRVLATASRGMYPASRFENISANQLRRHLLKGFGEAEGQYLVKKEVRSRIEFRRLNLMEDFSGVGMFQVIFCRNVMIYFDQPTQQRLVTRLAAQLEEGGHLLIGHAESLNGIDHPLQYVCPATYRKPQGVHRTSAARSMR
ncbi:MAG: CheR family methyltransferase [Acidobacteriaceae bacterium]